MNEKDKDRGAMREEQQHRPVEERPTTRDELEGQQALDERDRAMRESLERRPMREHTPVEAGAEGRYGSASPPGSALLGDDATGFRHEWETIQAGFVDEPRKAVEKADALVARAAQGIAERFSRERERLEGQWSRGDDVSTEDLRLALQRYRSFFDRLLSI